MPKKSKESCHKHRSKAHRHKVVSSDSDSDYSCDDEIKKCKKK